MLTSTPCTDVAPLADTVGRLLELRNDVSRDFFPREAERLARACRDMAERFARGGRLLAIGHGAYATDAQHVAVEFVHPVIVGKRALPALDLSMAPGPLVATLLRRDDIVMGFGPPEGDADVIAVLRAAHVAGAQTFALPGAEGSYAVASPAADPFVHQEMIEILYHTLWETAHVYLEHRGAGHDVGASGFLYPFLGDAGGGASPHLVADVAQSICAKAQTDERLRTEVADREGAAIARAVLAMHERIAAGGTLFLFGNGGSATDATDWALDCVMPPKGGQAIPALSLASDPATLTALANDIGTDAIFLRQLIAHAGSADVAVAISTSGGSANILAALEDARKRGMLTVALLGNDGGEVVRRGLADAAIVVRSDYIPRIQEIQASVYHVVVDLLHQLQREDAPTGRSQP